MKKDKQWAKQEIDNLYTLELLESTSIEVKKIIDQIDEPEKVKIPKWLADVIYYFQVTCELTYSDFAEYMTNEKNGYFDRYVDYEELAMIAWVNDYEIEKEPKYYIRNKEGHFILRQNKPDSPLAVVNGSSLNYIKRNQDEKYYQFTEQEIKAYDRRYWAFAKPVEETD